MNTKDSLATYSLIAVLVSSGLLFGIFSVSDFFNINSFAQKTMSHLPDSSVLQANKTVHFNTYENNEIGVLLNYPSNFLIDESKSNNTTKQISFYPVNNVNFTPEQYILWMDVFVTKSQSGTSFIISIQLSIFPSSFIFFLVIVPVKHGYW